MSLSDAASQRLAERDHDVEGHGVHALGPVEGDQGHHRPGLLDLHEGHGAFLHHLVVRARRPGKLKRRQTGRGVPRPALSALARGRFSASNWRTGSSRETTIVGAMRRCWSSRRCTAVPTATNCSTACVVPQRTLPQLHVDDPVGPRRPGGLLHPAHGALACLVEGLGQVGEARGSGAAGRPTAGHPGGGPRRSWPRPRARAATSRSG